MGDEKSSWDEMKIKLMDKEEFMAITEDQAQKMFKDYQRDLTETCQHNHGKKKNKVSSSSSDSEADSRRGRKRRESDSSEEDSSDEERSKKKKKKKARTRSISDSRSPVSSEGEHDTYKKSRKR